MRYFPVFMDISNKSVLVIGGGEVANRKVDALLKAGAQVTIVAPDLTDDLHTLVKSQKCDWVQEKYHKDQLSRRYVQVWAATNSSEVNHLVYQQAHELNLLVNVVDDQPYCDFITPAMMTRGRMQIAISSGGSSPVLVRNCRQAIEAVLPLNLGLLAEFSAEKREHIKQALPAVELRRYFWEQFFIHPAVQEAKDEQTLDSLYQQMLEAQQPFNPDCTVIFYGQDVELLPIKALHYMQQADLVISHPDCPEHYYELSRRDALKVKFDQSDDLRTKLTDSFHANERVCVLLPEQDKDSYLDIVAANRCLFSAVMNV